VGHGHPCLQVLLPKSGMPPALFNEDWFMLIKSNGPLKRISKKVLMLCETFPPESDVGGLRGAMFCKYLPKYGWTPIVFSRARPEGDADRRPTMEIEGLGQDLDQASFIFGRGDEEKALKRRSFFTLLKHFFLPDMAHPPGIVERWLSISDIVLTGKSFAAVWGTSPSLGCLTVAAGIAKHFSVPWIGDFRDIDAGEDLKRFRQKLLRLRMIHRRRQIVQSAAAVVTVSEHHARVLERNIGHKVHVIPNGFDPEMFLPLAHNVFDKFSIAYVGRIQNEWLRDSRPFFEGIDLLLRTKAVAKNDLDIVFYGTEESIIKEVVLPYQCRSIVRVMPTVPYREVPAIMQSSCILLLLTNLGRDGILTTKCFEYLAVKRPILCAPCDSEELYKLLQRTNSGISCATAEGVASALGAWYDEWKLTGTVRCESNNEEINRYSRKLEAGQLAELLDSICSERR
jgi:glycosyltransferase involved in cell wall biosynthesis